MKIRVVSPWLGAGILAVSLATLVDGQAQLDPALLGKPPVDAWPTHHGDYSGRHYSTLNQINQSNVKSLALAWSYRANTGEQGAISGGVVAKALPITLGAGAATGGLLKATPLFVNGVLYLTSPDHAWAIDAKTGREIWHFDMAPESGWEGSFVTATGDGVRLDYRDVAAEKAALPLNKNAWQTGGGSALTTPAIDPELGLLYFGTGSPSPQLEDRSRPGDNLYTSSLVALEIATGKLRWYYQQVPHDLWGYEVSCPAVLFDLPYQGRTVKAVGEAGKTGWFYVHDRVTGEFLFKSEAFIPQENMFKRPTPEGIKITPGKWGGASWGPASYDAGRGIVYVTALHAPLRYAVKTIPAEGGKPEIRYSTTEPSGDPNWGTLTAIDLRNGGRIQWQQKLDTPQVGGALATAGGVVFTGEGNGLLKAFDADTGTMLWKYECPAGVNAPPVAYEIDGVQYVAVAVGGNSLFRFKTGDTIMAFAVPAK